MQEPVRAPQIAAESLESRVLWSVTYYVSPVGDDTAAGTSPATPFQTIARVNQLDLEPGDKVLFKGNASYGGRLDFEPADAGTAILPVTISSFGGKATIDAQGGAGIVGGNVGGVLIKNLNVVGGTNPVDGAPNNNIGIAFTNELPGNVLLDAVRIEGVDVSGFGDFGIAVGGTNLLSGFSAVTVAKSNLHDNASAGVIVFAQSPRANHGVLISRVNAFRNAGTGIIVGGTDGAKVERCSAF